MLGIEPAHDLALEGIELAGARCTCTRSELIRAGSGPMVSADQRNVFRGKVLIQKDAFIAVNVTILPGVVVAPGTVAGAGVILPKNTEPWGIYVGAKTQKIAAREPVKWPGN